MSLFARLFFILTLSVASLAEARRGHEAGDVVTLESGERYFLTKDLGEGAVGTVFRATKPGANDPIAIKFFSAATRRSELYADILDGFARAKEMNHPSLLTFQLTKLSDGEVVVLMPVGEKSLHNYLYEKLDNKQRLQVALEIYALLKPLVQDLVLHGYNFGDLKPSNIVRVNGQWKVIDFDSIEKIGARKEIFTSGYAPTEVRTIKPTQWTSDAYSVGRILRGILLGGNMPEGINQMQYFDRMTLTDIYKEYPEFAGAKYQELRRFLAASLAYQHEERSQRLLRVGYGNSCRRIF